MDAPRDAIFTPDYAIHPGMLLEQELEHRQLSQADFARRIGRTPKLVSEIISGKNPVEPETAIQFEKVLGIGADVWLRMEAQFRLHEARLAERPHMATKKILDALERVWIAEIGNRLPFQSKAAIFKQLCNDGLIEPMTRNFGGDRFVPITVIGYQLTHAGRLLYCSSCDDLPPVGDKHPPSRNQPVT